MALSVPVRIDWREVLTTRRLLPLVLVYLLPTLLLYHLDLNLTFTPRGLDYSKEIAPLFLAPWAVPLSLRTTLSRLIQLVVLAQIPPSSIAFTYPFWLVLALIRGISGFVLTRSVGWAYPRLFSHWALYEPSAGFGPSLVAYLSLQADLPPYALPALTTAFCWLESRPWIYGTALLLALAIRLLRSQPAQRARKYLPLPQDESLPTGASSPAGPLWKPLFLCFVPLVPFIFIPSPRLAWPTNGSLDILMLTYPRPIDPSLDVELISTTINSYTPHLSPRISLAVFTHASAHPAFDELAIKYPDLTFYADKDEHPADHQGQSLHLAEAFRWWSENRQGEWVMLVEDDFPVCPGRWDVIETAMSILEGDRGRGEIRSGFIGTGGSGLIIHRSYLPLLSHILRLYSASDPIFLPHTHIRAPDQVVQDCLLGRPSTLCERTLPQGPHLPFSWFGGDEDGHRGNVVIGSRIVLDHIGGMATTQRGKALNEDKWRCGWRHPFEGDEQVEVIVV